MYKATARESAFDHRTIKHDLASPIIYTSGGVDYIDHENQHKVGICTAISLIQNAEKFLGKSYSPDFQYLLQKKFIDGDWQEGSSIFSALKVAKKYGFLPIKLFTYITEADRELPYEQYIAKLQSIPDVEITRLLSLCEIKLTGYSQVDISTKENIAAAVDSSKAGILCRYAVTNNWWTAPNGVSSWNPVDIDPLRSTGPIVGGHAITLSKYNYTQGNIHTLSNTWGNTWNVQGNAHVNFDNYKMTEAWIPYYDKTPEPHVNTPFETMMFAIRDFQVSKGVNDFKNETNPSNINLGPKTLALIAKEKAIYKTSIINTTISMKSIYQSKTAILGLAVALIPVLQALQAFPMSATMAGIISSILGVLVIINRFYTIDAIK